MDGNHGRLLRLRSVERRLNEPDGSSHTHHGRPETSHCRLRLQRRYRDTEHRDIGFGWGNSRGCTHRYHRVATEKPATTRPSASRTVPASGTVAYGTTRRFPASGARPRGFPASGTWPPGGATSSSGGSFTTTPPPPPPPGTGASGTGTSGTGTGGTGTRHRCGTGTSAPVVHGTGTGGTGTGTGGYRYRHRWRYRYRHRWYRWGTGGSGTEGVEPRGPGVAGTAAAAAGLGAAGIGAVALARRRGNKCVWCGSKVKRDQIVCPRCGVHQECQTCGTPLYKVSVVSKGYSANPEDQGLFCNNCNTFTN